MLAVWVWFLIFFGIAFSAILRSVLNFTNLVYIDRYDVDDPPAALPTSGRSGPPAVPTAKTELDTP